MQEANGKPTKKVGSAKFGGSKKLYKYEVPNAETGGLLGTMYMMGFKQPILDRYREIRNGNGRSKGDNAKAREYLFKKTFDHFEFEPDEDGSNLELDLEGEGCKTELEFFLTKAEMTVDAVVIQHVSVVFPDVDEKK